MAQILQPWLERIATRGTLAAPTAAALLECLGTRPDHLPNVLSLGVYLSIKD